MLQLGLITSKYLTLYPWIFFFLFAMTPISNHLSHCSCSSDKTIKSCIPTFWLGKYYAVTKADCSWLQIIETPSQIGFIIKKSNSPSSWKTQRWDSVKVWSGFMCLALLSFIIRLDLPYENCSRDYSTLVELLAGSMMTPPYYFSKPPGSWMWLHEQTRSGQQGMSRRDVSDFSVLLLEAGVGKWIDTSSS